MACLDTSALLDLSGRGGRRSRERVRRKVAEIVAAGEPLLTTRFNVAELWVGVERSDDGEAERQKVEDLLRPLAILDFEQDAVEVFGCVVGYLQRQGIPIGDMDALIASVCLVHGHVIVTRNTTHFERVPGLVVTGY